MRHFQTKYALEVFQCTDVASQNCTVIRTIHNAVGHHAFAVCRPLFAFTVNTPLELNASRSLTYGIVMLVPLFQDALADFR